MGDSVDDIEAAKRAGLKALGCLPPGVADAHLGDLLLKRGAEKVLANILEISEELS